MTRHLLRTGSYEVTPPDPTAQMGDINGGRPKADRSPKDTRRVSLCASQTPGQPPGGIFTVYATASHGSSTADCRGFA